MGAPRPARRGGTAAHQAARSPAHPLWSLCRGAQGRGGSLGHPCRVSLLATVQTVTALFLLTTPFSKNRNVRKRAPGTLCHQAFIYSFPRYGELEWVDW